MIRVVADTNVLIFGNDAWRTARDFLDVALLRTFTLVTSPSLVDELDEKLRLRERPRKTPSPYGGSWKASQPSSRRGSRWTRYRMILTITASWNAPLRGRLITGSCSSSTATTYE